jgi:hypothetical protein
MERLAHAPAKNIIGLGLMRACGAGGRCSAVKPLPYGTLPRALAASDSASFGLMLPPTDT